MEKPVFGEDPPEQQSPSPQKPRRDKTRPPINKKILFAALALGTVFLLLLIRGCGGESTPEQTGKESSSQIEPKEKKTPKKKDKGEGKAEAEKKEKIKAQREKPRSAFRGTPTKKERRQAEDLLRDYLYLSAIFSSKACDLLNNDGQREILRIQQEEGAPPSKSCPEAFRELFRGTRSAYTKAQWRQYRRDAQKTAQRARIRFIGKSGKQILAQADKQSFVIERDLIDSVE